MDWKNQQQMACNYNRLHKEKGLENIAHTHNALEDAKEQSIILGEMMGCTLYNI